MLQTINKGYSNQPNRMKYKEVAGWSLAEQCLLQHIAMVSAGTMTCAGVSPTLLAGPSSLKRLTLIDVQLECTQPSCHAQPHGAGNQQYACSG